MTPALRLSNMVLGSALWIAGVRKVADMVGDGEELPMGDAYK